MNIFRWNCGWTQIFDKNVPQSWCFHRFVRFSTEFAIQTKSSFTLGSNFWLPKKTWFFYGCAFPRNSEDNLAFRAWSTTTYSFYQDFVDVFRLFSTNILHRKLKCMHLYRQGLRQQPTIAFIQQNVLEFNRERDTYVPYTGRYTFAIL